MFRINTVIFNCVSISNNFTVFQSRNSTVHSQLYIFRKRGRHSSNVHFIRVQTLWLNKYLMSLFFSELNHLILYGRTISGTGSFDNPRINWRTIQVIPDDFMRIFIRISQPTGSLFFLYRFRVCGKRKRNHFLISELFFHFGKIKRTLIHSCRSSCLKTTHFNSHCFQRIRKVICCLQTIGSCIRYGFTAQTSRTKICTGAKNHSFTFIDSTGKGFDTCYLFLMIFCFLPE